MATYTDNYNLKKPTYAEPANVKDINDNMEIIDDVMHSTQISLADAYDINSTYNTGDIVMYEMLMYKCKEDNVTGAWDASKWERTTAGESGGNSVDVDEKFQTGLNVADVDVDGDQHYIKVPYMTGATSLADGDGGLVPAPETGDEGKFLKGDGTWGEVISGEKVYGEASGAIASFEDGTANPLEELVIGIEPAQAGTGDPSPSNPRAISGWTGANVNVAGVNVWDEEREYGRINTSTGENTNMAGTRSKNYIPVTPSKTYYIYSTENIFIIEYGKDKSYLRYKSYYKNESVTLSSDAYYIRFYSVIENLAIDISINYPSTDTDYHAYVGNTVNISWQTEAGTVYGGELDVKRGVLKSNWIYKKFSDLSFEERTRSGAVGGIYFRASNSDKAISDFDTNEKYTHGLIANPYNTKGNYARAFNSLNYLYLGFADDMNISSLSDLETWLTNNPTAGLCYKAESVTEYSIDPATISSILGTNNIWADTGDVINCKYIRDLNSTINILWNAVFNQSNTRSLSLMKSFKSEDTDTKEVEEEIEEEEPTEEEPKEEKR